jgi:hypothetical protein
MFLYRQITEQVSGTSPDIQAMTRMLFAGYPTTPNKCPLCVCASSYIARHVPPGSGGCPRSLARQGDANHVPFTSIPLSWTTSSNSLPPTPNSTLSLPNQRAEPTHVSVHRILSTCRIFASIAIGIRANINLSRRIVPGTPRVHHGSLARVQRRL